MGAVVGVIVLAVFARRPAWAHRLLDGLGRVVPLLRREKVHDWLDEVLAGLWFRWWSPRLRCKRSAGRWHLAMSVIAGYVMIFAILRRAEVGRRRWR